MRDVLRSGGARIVVVPISAALGIVNTRLIVDNFGESAYAQYGLLIGIVALLPFVDLGVSTAVLDAVARSDDPAADPQVRLVLAKALRLLAASGGVVALGALLIWSVGGWPAILGDGLLGSAGAAAATVCLVVLAVSVPFGFGQRVLAALGRNHVAVLIVGLQTPIVLVVLLILVHTGFRDGAWLAVVPYVVTLLLAVVTCAVAARRLDTAVRRGATLAVRPGRLPRAQVFALAWPTLVQMVGLAVAMQTDRIVLSHVGTTAELAQYNLAATMFVPIYGVVNAAGVALWPMYARARAERRPPATSPMTLAAGFGLAAGGVAALIAVASPWLARIATGGEVGLPWPLVVAFVGLIVVQALNFPLGTYMTDARGLRRQAAWIIVLVPLNLGLSWPLAVHLGAVGPVLGSIAGVAACQCLVNYRYVRRDLARVRDESTTQN